jgi:hypothetical protein
MRAPFSLPCPRSGGTAGRWEKAAGAACGMGMRVNLTGNFSPREEVLLVCPAINRRATTQRPVNGASRINPAQHCSTDT